MLKLIKDLGAIVVTKAGAKASSGIYECTCGEHITIRHTVANKKVTQCKKCGKVQSDKVKHEKKKVQILIDFKTVHKNTYNYDKVEYIKAHEKVTITCLKHGDFKQTPHAHKQGQGCPECAKDVRSIKLRKLNTHRKATLYYVYFKELDLYKLGVTVNIKHRFRGEVHIHEVLFKKEFNTEQEAYYVENLLLSKYVIHKYIGPSVLHRKGNTELLTKNILTTLQSSVETIENTPEFKTLGGSE